MSTATLVQRVSPKQLEKALDDIEKLKDSNREIHYKNGKNTE